MNLSCLKLFQTCKDTKFESNSQHFISAQSATIYCFRRAKIQNLRAIHNLQSVADKTFQIVSDVQRYKIWEQFTTHAHIHHSEWKLFQTCKDTKFESNSQHAKIYTWRGYDCFRRAKIQNLRAIHNCFVYFVSCLDIVSDVQRYKIWEQFTTRTEY